ncbi:MAG: AEC family transporter [Dermatophilaceae bacterium]
MACVQGVVLGFATIAAVIGIGALVAHLGIVDLGAQAVLNRVAFFVASPALLLTTVAQADVHEVLSPGLAATVAGVAVPAAGYLTVARWRWRRSVGEQVIGALASSYVNAGNLGLPVAAYVLGDAAFVAPTLLLQLVVLQPLALAVLDAEVRGRRPSVVDVALRPWTNPLTVGTLVGLVLAITGWHLPPLLADPVELVGAMAVPAMLLAYGIALRLGPGFGGDVPNGELAFTSALKLAVQPLVAYAVAHHALGVSGHALLAVVVCASLPTAQNIFVHASRYDRSPTLARDTILVTTVGSVPLVALVVAVLG